MERFNRAERRAQVERLKRKRKVYWGRTAASHYAAPMDERQLGLVVSTPKVMSWCRCCGNPRRVWSEPTLCEISDQQRRLQE